jgi:hypothetical protein
MKHRISEPELWRNLKVKYGNKGGIYKLFCVRDSKTIQVNRLLGSDINGILYIGETNSFIERVVELKKSLSPAHHSSNHNCGIRYKSINRIKEVFPYQDLFISFEICDNPKRRESELLGDYLRKFGELPPFNRQ